jgi:type II secretory pathway component GspD/PulD (secretin)
LHTDAAQVIQEVFMSYGLDATVDQSIVSTPVRLDMDSATFEEATRVLAMVTNSFYVPLDPHRVLVARDTRENRVQFMRQDLETIYLSGLTEPELTDVVNVAKNVFQMQHVVRDPGAGTITVRAPTSVLTTFNKTLRDLVEGRNQVLLDVRLIQLAHTSDRNTGVQPPQSFSAVNVYAEEQSILTANQALVQQIISSGLAAPGDTLAILGILLASGQISNSLFSNGIALFGGGITQSALSPGKMTANISLNSSDSRELEELQLRLGDGEDGKLTVGERYPIQTSSFSSLSAGTSSIAGLTGAGNSSALSSLLAAANSVPNVPQVEYQDLGLKLKATPRVMRNDEVALTIDLKIDALSGATVNDNPILANRSYEGVVIVKKGEAVVVAGELDKSESRAISGTPGISEIPGLNNLTDKDMQKNYSTLLIIMTPHVIRGTQADGHTPMMRIDKNSLEH